MAAQWAIGAPGRALVAGNGVRITHQSLVVEAA